MGHGTPPNRAYTPRRLQSGGAGGLPTVLRVSADAGAGSTAAASPSAAGGRWQEEEEEEELGGGGLTATEKRYRRELEELRSTVRELEGMLESRLEERERGYRRKLRAAVSECRSLRVSVFCFVLFFLCVRVRVVIGFGYGQGIGQAL